MAVGRNKDLSYAKDEIDVRLADGSEIRARAMKGGYMGATPERPYPDFEEIKPEDEDAIFLVLPEEMPKTLEAAARSIPNSVLSTASLVVAHWPGEEAFTAVVKNRFGNAGPMRVISIESHLLAVEDATPEEELREARSHITSLLRRDQVSETDRVTDEEAARRWLSER